MTTAETITNAQITALRNEAAEAGDLEQVTICNRALSGNDEARAECARVIADAEAMDNEAPRYVVATGEDADEWSRHATLADARAIAEGQRYHGPVSIWRAEDFDAPTGAAVRPVVELSVL